MGLLEVSGRLLETLLNPSATEGSGADAQRRVGYGSSLRDRQGVLEEGLRYAEIA
jgi:hypothetical protein